VLLCLLFLFWESKLFIILHAWKTCLSFVIVAMFLLLFALVVNLVSFSVLLLFLKWELWDPWMKSSSTIDHPMRFVEQGSNNFMLNKKVYIVLMMRHTQLAIGFSRLKPKKLFRSACLLYDFYTNLQWRCCKSYFVVFVPHCMNIFHYLLSTFFSHYGIRGSVRGIAFLWKTCDYKSNNGHQWVIR
jgi:hypothetical protein